MYSFRNDPDADGVGIAFFDAVSPNGERMDLSVGGAEDWRGADWALVEQAIDVPVLTARQVHGDQVLILDQTADAREVAARAADGLLTTSRGLGLAVRAADCLPVLFADVSAEVVAAAHAGRVGLAAGVLMATVSRMRAAGATRISAWIGPHVCARCYEVPAYLRADYCVDLPAAFASTSWGTPSLDLGAAAADQLRAAGCEVTRVDPCTVETPTLHSYRRDGAAAGRQAGVVWLPRSL